MKNEEFSIKKLFDITEQYIIPIYQRDYHWTVSNCFTLYYDIIKSINKTDGHFIGCIVCKDDISKNPDLSKKILIDGQQRITTILLILQAIKLVLNESYNYKNFIEKIDGNIFNPDRDVIDVYDKYKLISWVDKDQNFINIMSINKIGDLEQKNNNYYKNIINIINWIKTDIENGKYTYINFYNAVKKLRLIKIELSESDNAQEIFESINGTGEQLDDIDLLKNYFLMNYDNTKQIQLNEDLNKIQQNVKNDINEYKKLISYYITIKTKKVCNIKDLYKKLKEYRDEYDKDIEEIINDLGVFSKEYSDILEHKGSFSMYFNYFSLLDAKSINFFILNIYHDYQCKIISKDEVEKIFSMMESYLFRKRINKTKELNHIFEEILFNIDYNNYYYSVKNKFLYFCSKYTRSNSTRKFIDNETLNKSLLSYEFNNNLAKYILYKIEYKKNKSMNDIKRIQLEHIMPQKLCEEWKDDLGNKYEDIYNQYLYNIGNLTLTIGNSELGNKPFIEKRDLKDYGYKSSLLSIDEDLKKYEKFTDIQIIERNRKISKKIIDTLYYPKKEEIDSVKEISIQTLDEFCQSNKINGKINKMIDSSIIHLKRNLEITDDNIEFQKSQIKILKNSIILKIKYYKNYIRCYCNISIFEKEEDFDEWIENIFFIDLNDSECKYYIEINEDTDIEKEMNNLTEFYKIW